MFAETKIYKRRHQGIAPFVCRVAPPKKKTFAGGGVGGRSDLPPDCPDDDANGYVGRMRSVIVTLTNDGGEVTSSSGTPSGA